jgi:hypothetical protein
MKTKENKARRIFKAMGLSIVLLALCAATTWAYMSFVIMPLTNMLLRFWTINNLYLITAVILLFIAIFMVIEALVVSRLWYRLYLNIFGKEIGI